MHVWDPSKTTTHKQDNNNPSKTRGALLVRGGARERGAAQRPIGVAGEGCSGGRQPNAACLAAHRSDARPAQAPSPVADTGQRSHACAARASKPFPRPRHRRWRSWWRAARWAWAWATPSATSSSRSQASRLARLRPRPRATWSRWGMEQGRMKGYLSDDAGAETGAGLGSLQRGSREVRKAEARGSTSPGGTRSRLVAAHTTAGDCGLHRCAHRQRRQAAGAVRGGQGVM
jgi:hypothetical protein